MTVSPKPIRYLTRSDIGRVFGVTDRAVAKWQERYPADSAHSFPAPDAYAGELRPVPLWLPERLDEIKAWKASRPVPVRTGRPPGTRLGGNVVQG